jgi:hypothetical protein
LVERVLSGPNPGHALCRLIALGRYREKPPYTLEWCTSRSIRKLVSSPTSAGSVTALVVEANIGDEFAGEIILVDSDGYLVPVFAGASVADSLDDVFQFRGDDRWAIGHFYGMNAGNDSHVKVLHVVPVDNNQRPVLSLIVGPATYGFDDSCAGSYWSWRHRDTDEDGTPEIEIGRNTSVAGDIEPVAVYKWSKTERRYLGPSGSAEEGFVRFDGEPSQAGKHCCGRGGIIAEAFAARRLQLEEPGDPKAVRRSDCTTVTSETILIH